MDRRGILKLSALVAGTVSMSKSTLANNTVIENKAPLVVRFDLGVYSTSLPNGSWNIWVRADPGSTDVSFVRLQLQVSEDKNFTSIIAKDLFLARKETSYILRTNFALEKNTRELYFRFVALDTALPDNPKYLIVSPTGTLQKYDENKSF